MLTPYWHDDWLTVYQGDCREVMRSMEPESVHCVVTSPPYWGLRDYGTPGQLGLEATPEEYVANMVDVFREVRRVLRSDGTVWLNLGDSYNGVGRGEKANGLQVAARATKQRTVRALKEKDLVGIPWRVAFALQADGWYLRSDIIWSKPNPMPESVTDRPTKSHEYVFMLSKSPRYFWDADAVREANVSPEQAEHNARYAKEYRLGVVENGDNNSAGIHSRGNASGRNLRSVWTIATQPYPGAHFATFPRKLVEPCIKAGTSERGVCPECGAPWVRESVTSVDESRPPARRNIYAPEVTKAGQGGNGKGSKTWGHWLKHETTGWRPSCGHHHHEYGPTLIPHEPSDTRRCGGCGDLEPATVEPHAWCESCGYAHPIDDPDCIDNRSATPQPVPATVLDPFAGSGTTALVAQSLGRRAVLIDLSTDYLDQIMRRNAQMPLGAA